MHVFATMLGNTREAHHFKHGFERALFRRTKLNKFKAIKANGVFK